MFVGDSNIIEITTWKSLYIHIKSTKSHKLSEVLPHILYQQANEMHI